MIPPIGVKIFAWDTLSPKLAGLQQKLKKFGTSATTIGRTMSVGMTVPLAMMGYSTLKTAGEFEYGMNRVKGLTGATGDVFKRLEGRARDLAKGTTFTAGQVTEGMQMLAQAGLPVNDIYDSISTVLEGAQANMVEMSEAANIGAGLMKTFGYSGKEMITVMDTLTKTSISSMTNFNELAEAFLYAGPSAGAMGKTLKETSAVLGSLANGMMRGSMAGTALRGMMAKLTAPSAEAVSIMQSLGISYDDILDKKGNLKSFIDVVKAFEKTSVTAGQVLKIFGLRAGPGFQILLNQGSKGLEEMMTKVEKFGGTTKKLSDIQVSGFKGQMWMLVSAFDELKIAIAKSGVLEFVTEVTKKFTKFLLKLSETHPKLLKFSFALGAIAAVIGPVLIAVGAISAALAAISLPVLAVIAAIGVLTGAVIGLILYWDQAVEFTAKWGWALMFLMGPIGIVIWAVSLLIKYWDEVTEAIKAAFEWVEKIANRIADSKLGQVIGGIFSDIAKGPEGNLAAPYDITRLMGATQEQKPKAQINVNIPKAPPGTEVTAESEDIDTSVIQGLAYEY